MDRSTAAPPGRGPGRPRRSPEARAARRAGLLDAAIAAINRVGPDVSVDEIATQAGVSKPVLYSEFGDKHGIADAIAVEIVERAERDLMAELSGPDIDLTRLLALAVEGFFEVVTAQPAVYGFIFRSIRANDRGLLDNALVRSLQSRFEMVASIIAPDADPDLLRVMAHGTFGFILSGIESWLSGDGPDRDQVVDAMVTVLAEGLTAVRARTAADGPAR